MNRKPDSQPSLRFEIVLAIVLFSLILFSRILIDVPNFKPVMAVAMLAGFLFHRKSLGLATVGMGMLASDCLIGFYDWRVSLVVYAALLLPILAGLSLRGCQDRIAKMFAGVIGFAGLSAILFYVSTTIAVWAFYPWYGKDVSGLLTAFAYGLPFFKWTVAGNVLFSLLLFGMAGLSRSVMDAVSARRAKQLVPVKVRRG